MQIAAPAKINLNLRVLGRNDATGFHDIETWMTPVTLSDELEVELTGEPGIRLACDDPSLDPGPGNLAWKAAELFLRDTGQPGGAALSLRKNIPHGAGLGGGSSDAAAVLLALNLLVGGLLAAPRLETLAARLGSDVPFFIRRAAAMAHGRGEILEPCPLPRPLHLLLLKPPFGVATAWAYGRWSSGASCPAAWIAPQSWNGMKIFNDLEAPVFAKHLLLPALKMWLLRHPLVAAAGMSGSGSCLFAILREASGAEPLAAEARAEFGASLWTAACRTDDGGRDET